MMPKLFVSATLVGLVCGYVAMLYALAYTFALFADFYWQDLEMLTKVL